MHLPTPATLLVLVYAAALAVAVATTVTALGPQTLAGLVVLGALAVRWTLRRAHRPVTALTPTMAAVATVDAALPALLDVALTDPAAAPAVRAA